MTQMKAIADRSRMVNGVPTSLADLGYIDVGLDDNWQACGSYGSDAYTFHTEEGRPVVNQDRFPDFIAMTGYAHSLNLTAGWYVLLSVPVRVCMCVCEWGRGGEESASGHTKCVSFSPSPSLLRGRGRGRELRVRNVSPL